MARTPAPPGPPPPHYRPPGSAPSDRFDPTLPLRMPSTPTIERDVGPGPVAVTAVAVATLLIGLVAGFFLGRNYEAAEGSPSVAPATTPRPTSTTLRPPGDTIPQAPQPTPPTELAPSSVGSLEDPVPVGQAYVLGLYEVEVVSANRDAGAALLAFDQRNTAAPDGQVRVLVEIAIRFNDADGLGSPAAIPFFVSDGTTQWFSYDGDCGRIPADLGLIGFLDGGDAVRGNVCFTVPADAAPSLVLGTESFSGPLYFALPR